MNIKEIASDFTFIGNRISELKLKNDFIYIEDHSALSKEFDVTYDIECINVDESNIWGTINLYVSCLVKEETENSNDTSSELSIKLALNGCFSDNNDVSEEVFKKMLSVNGCAALYSIARSIITSIASQTALNVSIILPMINTFELVEKTED